MKTTLLSLLAAISISLPSQAQFVDLVSFGSTGIGALDSNSIGLWSQNSTSITLNAAISGGDNFYNASAFGPLNWSAAANDLYIKSTLTANPSLPFTLGIFDSSFSQVGTYTGTTSTFTSDGGFSYLNLSKNGTPNLSSVGYLQFTFDGGASSPTPNLTLHSIATVPEPSTYALMAIGGLVIFFIARRRMAQQV